MVHIGIIPDGNRRWCIENNIKQENLEEIWINLINSYLKNMSKFNKKNSYNYLKKITEISLYLCSIDNLNRLDSTKEIIYNFIRKLNDIFHNVDKYYSKNIINNIKNAVKDIRFNINFIGDLEIMPEYIRNMIHSFKNKLFEHNEKILNDKIINIHLAIAYNYKNDLINFNNQELNYYNREQSNIDLLFRSGKEKRISGFFPTKILYSELFFCDKYWPDIDAKYLNNIIKKFYKRNRRFGK